MSYGNWKHILGVFKLWKQSYDGILIISWGTHGPTAKSCPIHLRTFALSNTPPNDYYSRASPFHMKAIERQILQYISSEQHHPHQTLHGLTSSSPISHPIHSLTSRIRPSPFPRQQRSQTPLNLEHYELRRWRDWRVWVFTKVTGGSIWLGGQRKHGSVWCGLDFNEEEGGRKQSKCVGPNFFSLLGWKHNWVLCAKWAKWYISSLLGDRKWIMEWWVMRNHFFYPNSPLIF